jgi:phage-related protein (TIGR01555 family)
VHFEDELHEAIWNDFQQIAETEEPDLFYPQEMKNEMTRVQNGLGEALGFSPGGVGGLGSPYDSVQLSQVATLFKNNRWYLISNMRQLLSQIYVELGLIQTIVDVPVDDGLRGGVEITSKQLDEDQIQELMTCLDRNDDINVVGQACKWNRLYGGAGVLIMTDQDPSKPLNLKLITKDSPLEFRAVDMWELFWDKQNTEGYDPELQSQNFEHYNYYAKKLHKSRVMRMKGLVAPSFIRPRLRGWGFSVVEALVRSINQFLKANDLSFEVLDEFKLDVYKLKNLTDTLFSPDGDAQVRKRVTIMNRYKNYQNALVLDKEDDYDHKQLSFTGLAEVMQAIRTHIAADMRIPQTKLFGQSSAGFNSGEDDIEVYNAMVESQVRNKIKYDILRMIEIRCQQLFGLIPSDLSIEFKPLRMLGAEQEENVKTQKFTRLLQAKQANEITTFEFRDACNRDNLLSIQLDTSVDELNPDDPEVQDLLEGKLNEEQNPDEATSDSNDDPDAPKDVDDPGANREDTRKPQIKKEAVKNVKVFNAQQILERARAERIGNSADFDRASYAADGGDNWINPRKAPLYEKPAGVDEGLWSRAKEASKEAFGEEKWQFIAWWYKKQGGKYHPGEVS